MKQKPARVAVSHASRETIRVDMYELNTPDHQGRMVIANPVNLAWHTYWPDFEDIQRKILALDMERWKPEPVIFEKPTRHITRFLDRTTLVLSQPDAPTECTAWAARSYEDMTLIDEDLARLVDANRTELMAGMP